MSCVSEAPGLKNRDIFPPFRQFWVVKPSTYLWFTTFHHWRRIETVFDTIDLYTGLTQAGVNFNSTR